MARSQLILDRYEPIGTAGSGGFGTVQIAWDPRIQRKVAIKTIELSELDALRASLPGAEAVKGSSSAARVDAIDREGGGSGVGVNGGASPTSTSPGSTAERWHGVTSWNEFLEQENAAGAGATGAGAAGTGASAATAAAGAAAGASAATVAASAAAGASAATVAASVGAGADGPDEEPAETAEEAAARQFTSLAHLPGLDEARTAAKLDDQRIVTVFDFEVRDRIAYLIMEYVEGITLTQLLVDYEDYLTLDVVAAVFDSVAGALGVAHKAGVLHLDIKPDNIIINAQGQAKVTDFGLATLADASGAGTTGGGTIGYMPLEQMRREHLDARTDEWSLAAVTYEMLTGDNPFRARTLDDAQKAIENAELILPSLCWDDVDEQIDDVIFYALDPDSSKRYASVRDFAEEADKFLGDAEDGQRQLAALVADALGAPPDEDDNYIYVEDDEGDGAEHSGGHGGHSRRSGRTEHSGRGLFGTASASGGLFQRFGKAHRTAPDDTGDANRGPIDADAGAQPLPGKGPQPQAALARAFAAIGSGFLSFLAFTNLPQVTSAAGIGEPYVIAVCVAIVAALGALRPQAGALVGYAALGIALAASGQAFVGIALIAASGLWWYGVGRRSVATANCGLLEPMAGAFGASSAVPLVLGYALHPLQAIGSAAFSAVVALALGSLGTSSLLDWAVLSNWNFTGPDSLAKLTTLLVAPSTWTTIAGWLVAAGALSALNLRKNRWLTLLGIALATAASLVGSLVFAMPSPQLIAPICIAAAALIVVVFR